MKRVSVRFFCNDFISIYSIKSTVTITQRYIYIYLYNTSTVQCTRGYTVFTLLLLLFRFLYVGRARSDSPFSILLNELCVNLWNVSYLIFILRFYCYHYYYLYLYDKKEYIRITFELGHKYIYAQTVAQLTTRKDSRCVKRRNRRIFMLTHWEYGGRLNSWWGGNVAGSINFL